MKKLSRGFIFFLLLFYPLFNLSADQNHFFGVLINEILPSPKGPDEKEEWIEIFNQNNFEVDLSNWKIVDAKGKIKVYQFPQGTKISAKGFLVLSRPKTKITLNNEGDGLTLVGPEGEIIHSVIYEKAPQGHSYNRTPSGWSWSEVPTPGSENIILEKNFEEKIDLNTAPLEELIKIVHIGKSRAKEIIRLRPFYSLEELTKIRGIGEKLLKDIKKQGLAWVDPKLERPKAKRVKPLEKSLEAMIEPEKQIPEFLFLFFFALGLAIFSGVIILLLKMKIKNIDLFKKLK